VLRIGLEGRSEHLWVYLVCNVGDPLSKLNYTESVLSNIVRVQTEPKLVISFTSKKKGRKPMF
jgi:hypothetical protein